MPKMNIQSMSAGNLLASSKETLEQACYGTKFPYPPSEFDLILNVTKNIVKKSASGVNSEQVAEAILYIKKHPDGQNSTLISELNNPARNALNLKSLETYYKNHQDEIQQFGKGKADFQRFKTNMKHLRETYAQSTLYQPKSVDATAATASKSTH